jgi:hypothetical protein
MKRIIACAGIAALGAVSLQAAYAPGLSPTETAKFWSVSLGLRGFYDSNYNTAPENGNPNIPGYEAKDSFGFDVSPRVSLNFPMEATLASLDYTYGLRYYAARDSGKEDQSHQVNAKLDHAFSDNYKVDVKDSFAVAQEPEILENTGVITLPLRADGSNFRNSAAIMFHGEFTRTLGAEVGYQNNVYDYEQEGVSSYSALLDRMEHLATFNLRWRALQQTVAIFGYQYGVIDHNNSDGIFNGGAGNFHGMAGVDDPAFRDNRSHYFYVGADQNFTPTLNGSVRVGAQYTEYPNADRYTGIGAPLDKSNWSPYADANVTWTYMAGSSLQVGIRNSHSQTDISSLDVEATSLYASLTHQITAKLTGNLLASFQNATFNQGVFNDRADDYFTIGANLAYQFNQYLAAEAGYNFDRLDSDINWRSYTRNRVYLGLRASY